MRDFLRQIFRAPQTPARSARTDRHLELAEAPAALYAIGDVHGCLDELLALESQILTDSAALPGEKVIVMLGDYVDRGPNAAGVIDHLMARPPAGLRRICLLGNHELMAQDFMAKPNPRSNWLQNGGFDTLQSYGIMPDVLRSARSAQWSMMIKAHVPEEHIDFMRGLAWSLSIPGWLFVHAGLRPGLSLQEQHPDDLFWIRDEFYSTVDQLAAQDVERRVVHGHTPAPEPVITPARICVDTGAFATGRLTAVRIVPDEQPRMLHTGPAV